RQLGRLGRALRAAGWPADALASVVSRAGWPDGLASEHTLAQLAAAAVLHAGRPTVVTVGAGALRVVAPLAAAPEMRVLDSLPAPQTETAGAAP
ncbi:MAG: uroporphyrinogen-III C-methyltransferase, partial [Rubrivivax sp.]|nr:uroporphyrinogen-III C-methyltransferase [Rubrivivax sp.]